MIEEILFWVFAAILIGGNLAVWGSLFLSRRKQRKICTLDEQGRLIFK